MTKRDWSVWQTRRFTPAPGSVVVLACAGLLLFACAQTPTPTIETIEFSIVSDPTTAPLLDELANSYQDERPNVTVNLAQAVNAERALEAMQSGSADLAYVSVTPGAIGYVSPAWLRPSVNLVAVEGTTPSPEAIEKGRYVLARPFYFVARTAPSGGLAEFVDWVSVGNGRQIIARDYAPAP
jgi:ABC-type phosphate transport system substrate-binding protein